jgi:hypothetical protein
MAQISFEKYAELQDHENVKKVREGFPEFDFYITDDGQVRFFCMVEFTMRNPKYPLIDVVYGRGTYQEEIFDNYSELEKIKKDLLLRGKISTILFDKVNSTCKVLFSKLIKVMYGL